MNTKNNGEVLFLNQKDVIASNALDMKQAITDVEKSFYLFHSGEVNKTPKSILKSTPGHINIMDASLNTNDYKLDGVKLIGSVVNNSKYGLPRAIATIILYDFDTKIPYCILDGTVISAMRTGAVTGLVANKFLPQNKSFNILLVGAGVNMRTQLIGLLAARNKFINNIFVYSPNDGKNRFAKEMGDKVGKIIQPIKSVDQVASEVNIIITCPPFSTSPLIKKSYFNGNNQYIFNVGAYDCDERILSEMDLIMTDSWEDAKLRGLQPHCIAVKNNIIQDDDILNVSKLLFDKNNIPHYDNFFFAPVGLAIHDIIIADRIYKYAVNNNLGVQLDMKINNRWI